MQIIPLFSLCLDWPSVCSYIRSNICLLSLCSQPNASSTEKVVDDLRSRELIRVAVLDDNSIWCMLTSDHLQGLQVRDL